jgi:hypothetical protein
MNAAVSAARPALSLARALPAFDVVRSRGCVLRVRRRARFRSALAITKTWRGGGRPSPRARDPEAWLATMTLMGQPAAGPERIARHRDRLTFPSGHHARTTPVLSFAARREGSFRAVPACGVRRAACRVEGTAPRRTGGQRAAGEWRRDVRAGLREVITVRFARSLVLCAAGASRSQVHAGGCLLAAAKTDSSSFADVHVQY